jgi:hypothetical protein
MVTRFYDPQKEAMKERQERINQELGLEAERPVSYGANIKGKFRTSSKRYNSKTLAEARRKSNMRLIYIIIILCALFYFFLR